MLRYTDLEEAIRLARAAGLSTIQIVRALSGSVPYSEALEIARKSRPTPPDHCQRIYGATEKSIGQSDLLQSRNQLSAVALLRELLVIDVPFIPQ